ncbi:MAG: DNA/RNA non-specific endonuclease [Bacteroidales bacterium]|nr:DNA/RNA non-specific endonuclease [Bacteroidales bacterium]MBP3270494.1 DNA/RNA non-specific endonuclease [Bacteroidales bacterium]
MKGRKSYSWSSVAALMALSLMVVSCGGGSDNKEEPVVPPVVSIKTQTVTGEAGSQFLTVSASGNWTITTSASWLTVSPASGSGNSSTVILSYSENTDAIRNATVTITSSGGSASATLTQGKLIVPVTPSQPSDHDDDDDPEDHHSQVENGYGFKTAPYKWLELPQTKEDDGQEFFTHYMTLGGAKARNYSYYWNYDDLVAPWVAYPLCAGNIGSGGRTDQWGLDPLLPDKKQPVLYNAYSGFGSRGHQIPSADRLSKDANIQTFYFTNMTPQDYDFNGGIWANLENQVRTWAKKTGSTAGTDTLYVVTGCHIGSSTKKAKDNQGKSVSVPEGYFKALLRYKNNDSVGHSGFMACAFYYTNKNEHGTKVTKEHSMSIADLEKKLGYSLFVNLEAKVGASTAKTIKEENPATVSWWWQ